MLKKFLHSFARRRHPWRYMDFDELAEIYTSMSLRSLGFGIIGIFLPIFLYKNGVDLQSIFWFFTWMFLLRIPVAIMSAYVIGRIGPKHSIALSTLLFVIFLTMLLSFASIGWPLIVLAFAFTISNGLFFVAYDTDFSKVKHAKHGGKELGWLYIFDRAGSALGPFVGGLLAALIAPEMTIIFAIIILIGSLMPLFLTNEPVKIHQHITFKGFVWKNHIRDAVVIGSLGIDKIASQVFWPLFIAIAIFTEDTYIKIGSIVAIATAISLFSARMIGSFIDNKKSLRLLKYSATLNALLYLSRPFISSAGGAIVVTATNEPIVLGYRMPLVKGFYDTTDSEKGYRIVYIAWIEMMSAIAKTIYCVSLYVLCYWYQPLDVLRWSFLPLSLIALLMLIQKFPALKKA